MTNNATHPRRAIAIGIALLTLLTVTPVLAEDYEAVTAKDPLIPTDHLEILLTPLTQVELGIEIEGWIELVKAKAREISNAEIAVKFKNEEIDSAEEAADALEDAQEAAEKLEEAEQAGTTDSDAAQEAEEALEEAREAAEAAQAVTENDEVNEAAAQAEAQALEQAAEAADEDPQVAAPTTPETEISEVAAEDLPADADALQESADVAQQVADEQAEVKTALLDNLNLLREERTQLVDRTRVVLKAYEAKGGDPASHEQYLVAVSGIRVDGDDLESLWATVVGWMKSSEGGMRWAKNVGKFVAILFAFYLLSLIIGRFVSRALGITKGMSSLLRSFIETSAKRIVLVLGLIVAVTALEINVGPVLALIGAAGFVVAFALQDTLGNFASGIMILLYRPFDVGDVVDVAGVSGKVAALNLVSVTINTFDNKVTVVPNNQVWGSVIVNATGSRTRRVDLVFGIGYGDDMAKAQSIMEDLVSAHELVLDNPGPVIKVHELADSSVNFICRPWVKTDDYWAVYWDITRQVKEQFDAQGVSIPFPQHDVHLINEGGDDQT